MLRGLTLLLACQLAGQALAQLAHLPLPGPLAGLILLFGWCAIQGGVPDSVDQAGSALLRNFGLFFVPAGVGIITQLDVLGRNWFAMSIALGVSALLGLATTGWIMQRLDRVGTDDA